MDELASSLQRVRRMKDQLWSQPEDGCTGQGSNETAAARVRYRTGFNSIAYSYLVMLCYRYIISVDQVSLGLVALSALRVLQQASAPELTAPGEGQSHRHRWLQWECNGCSGSLGVSSVGRFLAARFQLLKQASLQAEHRCELKPGIKCLTAGCRGWQPVTSVSLGRVALPGHCHRHCRYCH